MDPATNEEIGFEDGWQSALSVGTPGVPRLMELLHSKYGNQPWESLFVYAKDLAINGFNITKRTEDNANELLAENEDCANRLFFRDQTTFDYFINPDCTAKPAGTLVTNPEYAEIMDLLAEGGADAFYTGPIAEDIIAKVAADRNPTGDALLSLEDMASYEVAERPPVCKMYRGRYNVCGMGPPSSGAIAVGQILGILDNFNLTGPGPTDVDTVHLFTQAGRLAFADRGLYVADPDFVTVPVSGMLNEDYLASRAALITDSDMGSAQPGTPPGVFDPSAPETSSNEGGTSHISIVDMYGNALSMTTTIESYFGSGLMVRGFLLNNQITDFSFEPRDGEGTPIANRVQPGKRPRSSMAPTMVFDTAANNSVVYLTGSPGGSRIIGYTAQSLVSMIDFGFNPQEACNTPHYQNRNGNTELEPPRLGITTDYDYDATESDLTARGHTVVARGGETSGLGIIQVTPEGGFLGGADPRRDGSAGGRLAKDVASEDAPTVAPTSNESLVTPTTVSSSTLRRINRGWLGLSLSVLGFVLLPLTTSV